MPAPIFPSINGLLSQKTHRFATLWRIERTDGIKLLFTDHDAALNFNYLQALAIPGTGSIGTDEVYTPIGGISSSAKQKQAGMQDSNIDLKGVIDSAAITQADLQFGRYRDAKVIEILTDWKHPTMGAFQINTYYITALTNTKEYWQATVSALPIWLRRANGWVYSHACRYDLFDKNCTLNKASFAVSGSVTTVINDRRTFTSTGLANPIGYFAYGYIVWNSGFNVGLSTDIKNHSILHQIELQLNTPGPIFVGDTFTAYPGCDKLKGTCLTKFSNLINFGGYPYLPGNDKVIRGPL